MKLLVNGSAQEVPDGTTVSKLLEILGARSEEVAVEVNAEVVRRAKHAGATRKADDRVEVVTFVGGG